MAALTEAFWGSALQYLQPNVVTITRNNHLFLLYNLN
jgi:hypothetical protein